jgi:uncharacterized repeat protein (TIGR03803 family)
MRNTLQHRNWISRMPLRVASAALALAAVVVSAVITTPSAQAQGFEVVHDFGLADGNTPEQTGLIQYINGDLLGTTAYGGLNQQGSIFKLTQSGTLTTIYSFCTIGTLGECVDASDPGALTLGTNGYIYGTTYYGGLNDTGAVFVMSPNGEVDDLFNFFPFHLFRGIEQDGSGAQPVGALVQATDGNLWGVTQYGGVFGQGAKFEISTNGEFFGGIQSFICLGIPCYHNVEVAAGLVQGADGNFYGTSEEGGNGTFGSSSQFGGSVLEIIPGVGTPSTLYSFCSLSDCTDGQGPMGALVQGANGNFYGTTAYGGTGTACTNEDPTVLGCGTVFEVTPSGTLTTLYNFCTQSGCPDGQNPMAGLVQGSDGNFYGTTYDGGAGLGDECPCGTIFEITPSGTLTTLYSFCEEEGCPSGGGPVAPLLQYTDGGFYGTTTQGGSTLSDNGTIFKLHTGLGPFVKTLPTSGAVGAAVNILASDMTGATSVTFNGVSAAFTLKSPTLITTAVPVGATSGPVVVTTPGISFTSNVNFLVTP